MKKNEWVRGIINEKGSLTAEASITLVCFIFFSLFIMAVLGGLYVTTLLDECLLEASTEINRQLPIMDIMSLDQSRSVAFSLMAEKQVKGAFEKRLNQHLLWQDGLLMKNFDASGSVLDYDDTHMLLTVQMRYPIPYGPEEGLLLERHLVCRKWSPFLTAGKQLERQGIEFVYLADHPSVYHTNPQCRSIKNRHRRQVTVMSLKDQFRECKFCLRERQGKNNE